MHHKSFLQGFKFVKQHYLKSLLMTDRANFLEVTFLHKFWLFFLFIICFSDKCCVVVYRFERLKFEETEIKRRRKCGENTKTMFVWFFLYVVTSSRFASGCYAACYLVKNTSSKALFSLKNTYACGSSQKLYQKYFWHIADLFLCLSKHSNASNSQTVE